MGAVVLRVLAGVALLVGLAAPAGAERPDLPFTWWQTFLTTPDGARLHVDVLRPPGVADDAKTPVLMTVSPYRSHLMYISHPLIEGGPSTENLPAEQALRRGYTYVIVDLRGFGGSSGCPDFGGPAERSDVVTAVEWAASQPWSTGRVGLTGTSYEAWTGMLGLAAKPKGLAAVAAFAPVVDAYSYLFMQGVSWKFSGRPVTDNGVRPADQVGIEHLAIASTPARPDALPEYQANALGMTRECADDYVALTTDHNPANPGWVERNLLDDLRGNTIPVFMGQGFVDVNTRPNRVFEAWQAMGPGDHRAWFGQWGHTDCHDRCGTPHFDDTLMTFFDRHVAGKDVEVPGPRVTVGQFDGGWRGEQTWPPVDSRPLPVALRTGSYVDRGLIPGRDREIWSVSQPLTKTVHVSGLASATLDLEGPPTAAVTVELYDIAPNGRATILTRGVAPVRSETTVRLLAQDWPLVPGHRLGARITDVVDDVWSHAPSNARVTVRSARLDLPVLATPRVADIPNGTPVMHARWRNEKAFQLGPDILDDPATRVDLPEPR